MAARRRGRAAMRPRRHAAAWQRGRVAAWPRGRAAVRRAEDARERVAARRAREHVLEAHARVVREAQLTGERGGERGDAMGRRARVERVVLEAEREEEPARRHDEHLLVGDAARWEGEAAAVASAMTSTLYGT